MNEMKREVRVAAVTPIVVRLNLDEGKIWFLSICEWMEKQRHRQPDRTRWAARNERTAAILKKMIGMPRPKRKAAVHPPKPCHSDSRIG